MRLKIYDIIRGDQVLVSTFDPAMGEGGDPEVQKVERNATFAEALAECYRLRMAAYAVEIPDGMQLDAAYDERKGKPELQAILDAKKDAIKARFPKPSPADYVDPEPTPEPEPEPTPAPEPEAPADEAPPADQE